MYTPGSSQPSNGDEMFAQVVTFTFSAIFTQKMSFLSMFNRGEQMKVGRVEGTWSRHPSWKQLELKPKN